MQSVNRLIFRASMWLHMRRFIELGFLFLTLAALIMVLLRIADRTLGLSVNWTLAWAIAVGASAGLAMLRVLLGWRSKVAVARVIDDRAGLREALSTALCVHDRSDPWSLAAVSHASRLAPGVPVLSTLPVRVPRYWAAPFVLVGAFFLAALIPQYDVLGRVAQAQAEQEQQIEIAQARAESDALDERLQEIMSAVDPAGEAASEPTEPEPLEPTSPNEVRQAAMKKLTSTSDRLDSLAEQSESDLLKQLKDKMTRLRMDSPGELSRLVESLRAGDFSQAKKDLEAIQEQMESGELSDDQRESLAQQLEALSQQLQELAEQRDALEEALREAGMDPELAQDMDSLRRALQQSQDLSNEQREMLRQMAESTQGACQRCEGMAQAASSAAEDMQNGSGGMSSMEETLSEMEMMQQQLDSIDAARMALQQELQSLAQSMGQSSSSMAQNDSDLPGGDKAGFGSGVNERDPTQSPGDLNKVKTSTKFTKGPVIGSTMVQGDQVVGESQREFAEAVQVGSESAAESIENQQVPRELHDAVKRYFGRLEERSRDEPAPKPQPGGPQN